MQFKWAMACLVVLLLSVGACASAPQALQPTAPAAVVSSAAATTAPATVLVASPEPAASPVARVLPAPLYLLEAGQIIRLEVDGTTRTQITSAALNDPDVLPISQFAVSPQDGALVFPLQTDTAATLVLLDPQRGETRELLALPLSDPTTSLTDPIWSPDGQSIVLQVAGWDDNPDGLYLLALTGGEPRLIVANDAFEADDVTGNAFGNRALAWSPDGRMLLVNHFALQVETCDLAVVSVADGEPVVLDTKTLLDSIRAPEDQTSSCDNGFWSADSSAVYFTVTRIGASSGNPGLWRADPQTGTTTPIIAPEQDGTFTLLTGLSSSQQGTIYGLAAQTDTLPPTFSDVPETPQSNLVSIDPATGTLTMLRPAEPLLSNSVLWARDGSGVVVQRFNDTTLEDSFEWIPVRDTPPVTLPIDALSVFDLAWSQP